MAKYDLPAMIEYVLETTGEQELFYAGHSMGTTAFMAMHHYRPDIGEKCDTEQTEQLRVLMLNISQDKAGQPPRSGGG